MRVVFLDRDGVINEDRDDYVKNVSELKVFPWTPSAVRRLNDAGFDVYVVSNQQGVAKGIISEDDLLAMQSEIVRQVKSAGGRINGFYYCRHLASDKCSCRKPEPGMLKSAAMEHGIDLAGSYMIGDSERDIIAGKVVGCHTVLVLTGKLTLGDAEAFVDAPDYVACDLSAAVDYVIGAGS
ncbi:MAG: D-glycero-beta-D-manno-heptose 1,7-bisphosphate 7-phosphatase [Armatimonadota bacterium]|nr:D-glycero-beta-D-manno-heptose 1,7-bisphosphate 7-phosphatase [bacterium]